MAGTALLLLALAPSPAHALDLALGEPRARGGNVVVDVRVSEPFSARTEESLSRAMPATLELHAELWRHRSGWFDRLESGFDVFMRVRYDVARADYRVERAGIVPIVAPSLDSLEALLSHPFALPLARVDRLRAGRRYYAVVSVTLRPMSIEDVEEIDNVIFPEPAESRRGPGLGIITGLPVALFDAVRNLAGLGDQRARAISGDFVAEDLDGR
jgi:hypothetical protein